MVQTENRNALIAWIHEKWDTVVILFLTACMAAGGIWYAYRWISPEEAALRRSVVEAAEGWLGCNEADGSHQEIIDFYNAYDPSPRDYKVGYSDNWCATFASAVALKTGLEGIIPLECSCEQQILLFDAQGDWQEDERYLPRTGDYIYYVWDEWRGGNCTAWADHVGIVVDTFGPVIKVIEGNKDDAVGYRYIFLNDIAIRGFGRPNYQSEAK